MGSVAKALIALGILRLVTEGRLTLDTPISQLLPNLVFDNPWEASHPSTVRHLLDHTAGLDDARLWQVFSLEAAADTPVAYAFAGDSTLLRVRSRPGSRCSYSNMGYGLLGMAIEAIAGERYEPFLNTKLLRPLGMADSSFAFVSQSGPHGDHRLAMGHFEHGVTQAAVPIYLRPPTQFTTTAHDMAVLSRFLMSDGHIGGHPFNFVRVRWDGASLRLTALQSGERALAPEGGRAGLQSHRSRQRPLARAARGRERACAE